MTNSIYDSEYSDIVNSLTYSYSNDRNFKLFFDWLKSRGNSPKEIDAGSSAVSSKVGYKDVIEIFKSLQDLNLGNYIVGRRGGSTRFEWTYEVKARELAEAVFKAGSVAPPQFASGNSASGLGKNSDILHSHALRPDLNVSISLPADLTKAEAERLANWIVTLPFD